MEKIQWKGGTMLSPVPAVMVSCGTMEKPNIMTIAWTGTLCTIPPKTYISVRPERYSYPIIKESGEFVINLTTEQLVFATDYCGVKSGRDVNKFEACKLTPQECTHVKAPMVAESPISLECKVTDIVPLGSHDMIIADIVGVNVDASLLDESGALHMEKANLIAYSHGCYYTLGEKLGYFGYSISKKKTAKRRGAPKKKR